MQAKEFALYKGEELIAMGTKREIAEQLGVSAISRLVITVRQYMQGVPVKAKEGDWLNYEI